MSVTDFGIDGPARPGAPPTRCSTPCRRPCRGQGRRRDPGAAAERHRLGHRRGTGRVGGAGRLLPPVALRHRRLHRFLPLRGGRAVARSAVRIGGTGRRRPETVQRTVARPAPKPADLPDFACRDGHVRLCLLSARQWRGMRAWLGEPEQFQDPKFDTIAARYARVPGAQRRPSPSCSPRRRWTSWSRRASAAGCRSPRCSARQKRWRPSTSGRSAR